MREVTSSIRPKRPMGILDSMKSMWLWVIWSNIGVYTAAGVTQFTRISVLASSLPRDLVSPMTPAFEALYADALGFPSLPAMKAMLTMRPYSLRTQMRNHRTVAVDEAVQVHIDHLTPGFDRVFPQSRVRTGNAHATRMDLA